MEEPGWGLWLDSRTCTESTLLEASESTLLEAACCTYQCSLSSLPLKVPWALLPEPLVTYVLSPSSFQKRPCRLKGTLRFSRPLHSLRLLLFVVPLRRLRLRRHLSKVTQGSHGLCLPLAHLLSTPTAARKPWEPWGGEEGSCRVRSKGGFPSSPLTPQPVARPPAASQGHTPAGRAIQGISSPPGTPPSRASLFLCSPNSPESGASSIGIARSQEQGENEAPGPQGGLGTGVLAGWRRG